MAKAPLRVGGIMRPCTGSVLVTASILVGFLLSPAAAEDEMSNEACLACHGMEGFSGPNDQPLFINGEAFNASVHAALALHDLPRRRHRHPARAAQEGRHRALRHVPRRHRGRRTRRAYTGSREPRAMARRRRVRIVTATSTRSRRIPSRHRRRTGRRWRRPVHAVTPTSRWRRSSRSRWCGRPRPICKARTPAPSPLAVTAPCAPTATVRTASYRPAIRSRRSGAAMCRRRAGRVTRRSSPTTAPACTAKRWRAAYAKRRCAPTVTVSTASSAPPNRPHRCSRQTFPARPVAAATPTSA